MDAIARGTHLGCDFLIVDKATEFFAFFAPAREDLPFPRWEESHARATTLGAAKKQIRSMIANFAARHAGRK